MKTTYSITVPAPSPEDAVDIAKRRARDDGYAPDGLSKPVLRVGPPVPMRFAVELFVVRRP